MGSHHQTRTRTYKDVNDLVRSSNIHKWAEAMGVKSRLYGAVSDRGIFSISL